MPMKKKTVRESKWWSIKDVVVEGEKKKEREKGKGEGKEREENPKIEEEIERKQ